MKYRVTCKDPKVLLINSPRPYALHKNLRYKDTLGDIVAIATKEFRGISLNQLVLSVNRHWEFLLQKKF